MVTNMNKNLPLDTYRPVSLRKRKRPTSVPIFDDSNKYQSSVMATKACHDDESVRDATDHQRRVPTPRARLRRIHSTSLGQLLLVLALFFLGEQSSTKFVAALDVCDELEEETWDGLVSFLNRDTTKDYAFAFLCPFEIRGVGCPTSSSATIRVDYQQELLIRCGYFFLGGDKDTHCTIDCPNTHFTVSSGQSLRLENVQLQGSQQSAVVVESGGRFTASNCKFLDNDCTSSGGSGGAIKSQAGSDIVLENDCIFSGNRAWNGGAVEVQGDALFQDAQFFGNTANGYGGALYFANGANGDVSNSVFDGNAVTGIGSGPAVYSSPFTVAYFNNNEGCGNTDSGGNYCNGIFNGVGQCQDFEETCAAPTSSPSNSPTAAPTSAPTVSPTIMPTSLSPTGVPTTSPSSIPPAQSPTAVPSISPTTSSPTSSPSTNTPTTVSPSSGPTTEAPTSPFPTGIPTTVPTDEATPFPTSSPSAGPQSPAPTGSPTDAPSSSPSRKPSLGPTIPPVPTPFDNPTVAPVAGSTDFPTTLPTKEPTVAKGTSSPTFLVPNIGIWEPTSEPSLLPTGLPTTGIPSDSPTEAPSFGPTASSTSGPTAGPTEESTTSAPSPEPTRNPTRAPTTEAPSPEPTRSPTREPSTEVPSPEPTNSPTESPSETITDVPSTISPTLVPTNVPPMTTATPTAGQTMNPTASPTSVPTMRPSTETPTSTPSASPTKAPSPPTSEPTPAPSTSSPTSIPTMSPTMVPSSAAPTVPPTDSPTEWPSRAPTWGNDRCPNAQSITPRRDDSVIVVGDTAGASPARAGQFNNSPAIYFTFVGGGKETRISTCSGLTGYDSKMYLARGGRSRVCHPLGGFTYVNYTSTTDFSCDVLGRATTLEIFAERGFRYMLAVSGMNSYDSGSFGLSVQEFDAPTSVPTVQPTARPTIRKTPSPTDVPTEEPSRPPTDPPSDPPTRKPTPLPTIRPSAEPTLGILEDTDTPLPEPTSKPTNKPSNEPTRPPTSRPTVKPSPKPSRSPTPEPSDKPTFKPSPRPSFRPTKKPTPSPSNVPTTDKPSPSPTGVPTNGPTTVRWRLLRARRRWNFVTYSF